MLPTDVVRIIYKMKHEMEFSAILAELLDYNWTLRRIELSFQALARDGKLYVSQFTGGCVGQSISLLSDIEFDFGYGWQTYDPEYTNMLLQHTPHKTDNTFWEENYGTWQKNIGSGFKQIRLMIRAFPRLREFDEFQTLSQPFFWKHFPGFFAVSVIIPSICVSVEDIPLEQSQLAVKYDFVDDMTFVREQVDAMSYDTGTKQYLVDLIEFLSNNPLMLLFSPKLRDVICEKLDEMVDEMVEWTMRGYDGVYYTHYLQELIERMTETLERIKNDSRYLI